MFLFAYLFSSASSFSQFIQPVCRQEQDEISQCDHDRSADSFSNSALSFAPRRS